MKTSYALLVLAPFALALPLAHAAPTQVDTRVVRLQPSAVGGELEVLSGADGRVYTVKTLDRALVLELRAFERSGLPASLQIESEGDEDRVVGVTGTKANPPGLPAEADGTEAPPIALGRVAAAYAPDLDKSETELPASYREARADGFEPSRLASMAEADDLFGRLRALKHHSQCHERAMVWAYDLWAKRAVKSMKVVLFFTDRFRNIFYTDHWYGRRAYKWWYHTAPFVYVDRGGEAQEVVLDPEFVRQAKTMHDWTHYFMSEHLSTDSKHARLAYDETGCQEMTDYKELYANSTDWCLTRKLPMYYMMPMSFEAHDGVDGRAPLKRTTWEMGDVRLAYRHAPGR